MKLTVINANDMNALKQVLGLETDVLLLQDGVYLLNKALNINLGDRKVHALDVDVQKRGLSDRLVDEVELIDYDGMVDLLFSSETVVNL
jgi:sulfur relay protein TusB/DsrH